MAAAFNGARAAITATLVVGCQPSLAMTPGVPMQVERGYCFGETKFVQRGEQRSRDDTLDRLSTYPATEGHVSDGRAYKAGQVATLVGGLGATGVALASLAGEPQLSEGAVTALILSGGVLAAVSFGLCLAGEGEYVEAVRVYNDKVVPALASPTGVQAAGKGSPGP